MDFSPVISPDLKLMDTRLFTDTLWDSRFLTQHIKSEYKYGFSLTEEQELLLASIRELITSNFPEEYFRTCDQTGTHPKEFMQALAENGISMQAGRPGRIRRHSG